MKNRGTRLWMSALTLAVVGMFGSDVYFAPRSLGHHLKAIYIGKQIENQARDLNAQGMGVEEINQELFGKGPIEMYGLVFDGYAANSVLYSDGTGTDQISLVLAEHRSVAEAANLRHLTRTIYASWPLDDWNSMNPVVYTYDASFPK